MAEQINIINLKKYYLNLTINTNNKKNQKKGKIININFQMITNKN